MDGSISMGIMRRRKWWAAFAIVALAFLSLRPACEVWLSHTKGHGGVQLLAVHAAVAHEAPAHAPHDTPCCASIEGPMLVKPADTLVLRIAQMPTAATLNAQAVLRVAVPSLHALSASVVPPGIASFYVRSARILR